MLYIDTKKNDKGNNCNPRFLFFEFASCVFEDLLLFFHTLCSFTECCSSSLGTTSTCHLKSLEIELCAHPSEIGVRAASPLVLKFVNHFN